MSENDYEQNKSDAESAKIIESTEEEDTHCGHIFYNKSTWLLKYSCTFCELIFDDINIFCDHLTRHVAEHNNIQNDDNVVEEIIDRTSHETDDSTIVDRMEDYCEEVGEPLDNQLIVEGEEFDIPPKITEMNELNDNVTIIDTENDNNVDFEQFIEEKIVVPTKSIPKLTPQQNKINTLGQKKRKKVTRVKIIAVKNRIAELYEQIKREERKRSENPNTTTIQEDTAYTTNPLLTDNEDDDGDADADDNIDRKNENNESPKTVENVKEKENTNCTCPACGQVFSNRYSLTRHKRTHYMESKSDIKLAHKCPNCDGLFNRICELKIHLQKVHYPDGFICQICNRELTSIALLETHMRKVHLSKPFNCGVCNKNFNNREEFEIHEGTHFIMSENFKCRICGRKYPTEMALNLHLRNHKEQVPERCVVCGKMTLRLTQHMKIHQPGPKRLHTCHICGKTFNFSSGLSQHKRNHEKESGLSVKVLKNTIPQKRNTRRRFAETEITTDEQQSQETMYQDEEAKRVIVELIQNVTYKSFAPDDSDVISEMPIAREETISSVNNISFS